MVTTREGRLVQGMPDFEDDDDDAAADDDDDRPRLLVVVQFFRVAFNIIMVVVL